MRTTFVLGTLTMVVGVAGCATAESARDGFRSAAEGSRVLERPATSCHVSGAAQTVASGVYVPAGVEASVEDDQVTIRFARRKAHCEAAYAPSIHGHFVRDEALAECPGERRDAVATSEGETLLAQESPDSAGQPHIELGVVVHDVPNLLFGFAGEGGRRVVHRDFEAPTGGRVGGQRSPGLVPLPGERFLLVWIDGDSSGRQLRAQPIAGWGDAAGPAFDVSPADVSVIGHPSAVVGADGRGVVTFLASSGDGFDVLATPIVCETP
jgi:hypothetical protein